MMGGILSVPSGTPRLRRDYPPFTLQGCFQRPDNLYIPNALVYKECSRKHFYKDKNFCNVIFISTKTSAMCLNVQISGFSATFLADAGTYVCVGEWVIILSHLIIW